MNIAIEVTPLGMGRLHRRTFRVVVAQDARESDISYALANLAIRESSWFSWLGIGFSQDEILYGSRNVYETSDPITHSYAY